MASSERTERQQATIPRHGDACGHSLKADRRLRLDLRLDPTFGNRPISRHQQIVNVRRLPAIGIGPPNDRYEGETRLRHCA